VNKNLTRARAHTHTHTHTHTLFICKKTSETYKLMYKLYYHYYFTTIMDLFRNIKYKRILLYIQIIELIKKI